MTTTTNAHATRTVVEGYVAALGAGDEPTVRESFAESATWHLFGDLPMSGVWEGRDTILGEFLAGALSHYEPGSIRSSRCASTWTPPMPSVCCSPTTRLRATDARRRPGDPQPYPHRLRGRRGGGGRRAPPSWLTFAVVGGGPTGVEMAGQIAELARETFRGDFRAADPRAARVLLVEAGGRLLQSFPESLSRKALRDLEQLGVTPLLGHKLAGIAADSVAILAPGGEAQRIPARTVV